MCRKVVLTKVQAEEFESFKKLRNGLEEWARDRYDPNAPNSVIHNLTFDEVAHAYYIGYEIEPEQPKFQLGDKVIVTWNEGEPTLHEVQGVRSNTVYINTKPPHVYNSNPPKRIVRHATPEEIFWLETLGRERVGDYKDGDILTGKDHVPFVVVSGRTDTEIGYINKGDAAQTVKGMGFIGLLPVESFRRFPKEQSNER